MIVALNLGRLELTLVISSHVQWNVKKQTGFQPDVSTYEKTI